MKLGPGSKLAIKCYVKQQTFRLSPSLVARRFSFPFHAHRGQFTNSARSDSPDLVHSSQVSRDVGAVGELSAVCVKGKRETSCTKTNSPRDSRGILLLLSRLGRATSSSRESSDLAEVGPLTIASPQLDYLTAWDH